MRRFTVLICIFLAILFFAIQLPTAHAAIDINDDVDPLNPGDWNSGTDGYVGKTGIGSVEVDNASILESCNGYIGYDASSTGSVTVDGAGSTWNNPGTLKVGRSGDGTLDITNGAAVNNGYCHVGCYTGSTGEVTVDGANSTWTNSTILYVGYDGSATLNITNGGLVSVGGNLTIDSNGGDDCFINMATGGMLALAGDGDDSLTVFLDLVNGTDAIRWWDDSVSNWALLTTATLGEDYTLVYLTGGDLDGYTLLTVGTVPEPGALSLLIAAALGLLIGARWKRKV